MEVSIHEVSGVIRLVREVSELWDDPSAWRTHLLQGACRLVDGHVGMMLANYGGENGYFGHLGVVASYGVPAPLQPILQQTVSEVDHRSYDDVGMSVFHEGMNRQGWVTIAGNMTDGSSSVHRRLREPLDSDDYIVSIRVVDVPKRPEAISIDRPIGAAQFGEREVALLKLLHDEIAPLIGIRLATEDHISRDGLSRRLRETLSLLLEGHSEKQVASTLQLGPRTIHDYVTRLYEHFHVSSRAELLAYFIRRTPALRNYDGKSGS